MRPIDGDALKERVDNLGGKLYSPILFEEMIKNAPTIEAEAVAIKNGWKFVEDDLPKDSEKVLCLTVGNFYEILCKIIGGWRCPLTSQEFYTDFVRYWQPLPKLPERSDTNAERTL